MADQVIDACNLCGGDVRYGEECVTLNLHTERWDGWQIEVLGADVAVLLCSECGSDLDPLQIRQTLKEKHGAGAGSWWN